MLSEQEIRSQLQAITELKIKIETRLWDNAHTVTDSKGVELSEANIQTRIEALADLLVQKYPNAFPVLVGLMDGALPFANRLNDALTARNYRFQYTCMQVSSYGSEMQSGKLTMGSLPKIEQGERLIIIVDDVCDTGKTFDRTRALFLNQGAKEVLLMTLVDKAQVRAFNVYPDFSGFKVSKDAFIIGFGLDFNGTLRAKTSIKSVNTAFLPTTQEQALLDQEKPLNMQLQTLLAKKRTLMSGNSPDGFFATADSASMFGVDPQSIMQML